MLWYCYCRWHILKTFLCRYIVFHRKRHETRQAYKPGFRCGLSKRFTLSPSVLLRALILFTRYGSGHRADTGATRRAALYKAFSASRLSSVIFHRPVLKIEFVVLAALPFLQYSKETFIHASRQDLFRYRRRIRWLCRNYLPSFNPYLSVSMRMNWSERCLCKAGSG